MQKVKEYTITGLSFVVFVVVVTMAIVPTKGPGYCRKEIKKEMPALLVNAHEIDSMYTRTVDGKWVTSLVFQSKDLNQGEITVVCSYESTNYVFEKIKTYEGNKISRLKKVTTSNYFPTTWFQ